MGLIFLIPCASQSQTVYHVGPEKPFSSINKAIRMASEGDSIFVYQGLYKEGNIKIDKAIIMVGVDMPILDGEMIHEVVSIISDNVLLKGFNIINSGISALNDPCGVKVYDAYNVIVENCIFDNNFFSLYFQYSKNCKAKNNIIKAYGADEQAIGNGIHCWKSDSLQIIGNKIEGHRDGIYLEFVTNSIIWCNISKFNKRYGLHFMFSHNDAYINNYFEANEAGVAVMYTKNVIMYNNTFTSSVGDASYGILLKEISDAEIVGNKFTNNTSALFLEGANRIIIRKNIFEGNGWGFKIQANCMDNYISENNFINNTFDISTNGSLVLNKFERNYWDQYQGYDLDKDGYGDIPYHPLSLFSVLIENNPIAMLLYRSFIVTLLERTEKNIPSITPVAFQDTAPIMKKYIL